MAPVLNDVATDLVNPPQFVANPRLNPLPPSFKSKIFQFYQKELQALQVVAPMQQAFAACIQACARMPRWKLSTEDAAAGIIEGVATSRLLRFKDDFVIRLTTEGDKTRIDMRSKSRVGRGDLGANANRIRAYLECICEKSGLASERVQLVEAT
jgi:uncharacterized protein (DUF1499 family)